MTPPFDPSCGKNDYRAAAEALVRPNDVAIEVGCAGGKTTMVLGRQCAAAYGIDKSFSPSMLFEQQQHAKVGGVHFEQMDALDLDALVAQLSKRGVVLFATSPECDGYCPLADGTLLPGTTSAPLLFGAHTRVAQEAFERTGVPYVAETTLAARHATDPAYTVVHRASDLGVQSSDPHCFMSAPGYLTHVDQVLAERLW